MAIPLSDNMQTNAPKSTDSRYNDNLKPWSSISAVNSGISQYVRYTGLTVNIEGEEYWYKTGITDTDLMIKNDFLKLDQSTPQNVSGGTPMFNTLGHNIGYVETGLEAVGTRYWDADNHTTTLVLENGVKLQEGQEAHIWVKNGWTDTLINGTPVSIIPSSGQHTVVGPVDITVSSSAFAFIGLTTQDIEKNQFGYVTVRGEVRNINTDHLIEGLPSYVDISGGTTSIYPTPPNYITFVGLVEYSHQSQGRINLLPAIVPRLCDLSDVDGTPLTATGQIPVWNNDTQYFDFNINISGLTGQSYIIGTTLNVDIVSEYTPTSGVTIENVLIKNGVVTPDSFTVTGLPDASGSTGGFIYVSNESGGAQMAFSDGTDWRRFTDRNVVS